MIRIHQSLFSPHPGVSQAPAQAQTPAQGRGAFSSNSVLAVSSLTKRDRSQDLNLPVGGSIHRVFDIIIAKQTSREKQDYSSNIYAIVFEVHN